MTNAHEKINYVEFPSRDLIATRTFFEKCFRWKFTDYGTDDTAFENAGLEGGFFKAEQAASTSTGSALVVFYSERLEETQARVQQSGGDINREIFSFPGGRRFHFTEPCGNEFAVWSDK